MLMAFSDSINTVHAEYTLVLFKEYSQLDALLIGYHPGSHSDEHYWDIAYHSSIFLEKFSPIPHARRVWQLAITEDRTYDFWQTPCWLRFQIWWTLCSTGIHLLIVLRVFTVRCSTIRGLQPLFSYLFGTLLGKVEKIPFYQFLRWKESWPFANPLNDAYNRWYLW